MKEKIQKECYRQIRSALQTGLNVESKLEIINTLAVEVVTYSFNIINWNFEGIIRMDRKIRMFLASNRMHPPPPPKADVNRIYAPKRERRRGIINLEICFQTTTIGGNKQLKRAESLN